MIHKNRRQVNGDVLAVGSSSGHKLKTNIFLFLLQPKEGLKAREMSLTLFCIPACVLKTGSMLLGQK